jgi:hypothetical protein
LRNWGWISFAVLIVIGVAAARQKSTESDLGYVLFRIKALSTAGPTSLYDCSYTRDGKTARFKIELTVEKQIDNTIGPIWSGRGRFIPYPTSDPKEFLRDLGAALHAKKQHPPANKVSEVKFEMVQLADKASWDPAGGLNTKPPGDWLGYKLFLGKKDDAEVFLDLNPIAG